MAVPFSNTKLRPPQGFRNILESLSREILRTQPRDIYAYGTLYLDKLLAIRKESGYDTAVVGAELEDLFYNKVFRLASQRLCIEDEAARKIQTKYRQYKATQLVKAIRANRAASKIQAGFQGFIARKKFKILKEARLAEIDAARHIADLQDEDDLDREFEFPATSDYQDAPNNVDEAPVPLEGTNVLMSTDEAAARIQAGIQGVMYRMTQRNGRERSSVLSSSDSVLATPVDQDTPDLNDLDQPTN